jgi:signal transduction histidine kinase
VKRRWLWLVSADLRGQVAAILLLGLLLSQLIAAVLYIGLISRWQRVQRPDSAIARIEMVSRVMENTAPEQRAGVARSSSESDFILRYQAIAPLIKAGGNEDAEDQALRQDLAATLKKNRRQVFVDAVPGSSEPDTKRVQIGLVGGGSLEIVTAIGLQHRLGLVEQVGIAIFLLSTIAGLWAWLTWMVNAPLARVARAAEHVGLDIQSPPLAQQGPAQLQRVIRALNDMQRRLQRFLLDRTAMLAAIGHELRTPLTRLRLRIETNRAADEKSKMLEDIAAMEYMLNSTLSFVRGVDDAEPHEAVDLALLVQTACDTVSDLGGEVVCAVTPPCRYRCKPHALMRALTNIIANAVKHAGSALVTLDKDAPLGIAIEVADEGRGVPDDEKEKVFEPFYRSKTAISDDGHGLGLGLSIARSVILSHGGTIDLLDRLPKGLLVRITLPKWPTLEGN